MSTSLVAFVISMKMHRVPYICAVINTNMSMYVILSTIIVSEQRPEQETLIQ